MKDFLLVYTKWHYFHILSITEKKENIVEKKEKIVEKKEKIAEKKEEIAEKKEEIAEKIEENVNKSGAEKPKEKPINLEEEKVSSIVENAAEC